ncbi:hypothetical protein BU26DRAFT_558019 [Trematosphaeria pertusa]|uniref:Uncharacterized protein n=1 Tax=Trematosphaeria pertusa TaxID=390896 RepID=A0A6A6J1X3_9PLEO|nr:uncharacterized protein BU26DRAFT_558019 [Trematosphaeria pertusa]KAF2256568.1 hypothetical protein BU26DRAFT_558019 [Trematosphaeria pertusa]
MASTNIFDLTNSQEDPAATQQRQELEDAIERLVQTCGLKEGQITLNIAPNRTREGRAAQGWIYMNGVWPGVQFTLVASGSVQNECTMHKKLLAQLEKEAKWLIAFRDDVKYFTGVYHNLKNCKASIETTGNGTASVVFKSDKEGSDSEFFCEMPGATRYESAQNLRNWVDWHKKCGEAAQKEGWHSEGPGYAIWS